MVHLTAAAAPSKTTILEPMHGSLLPVLHGRDVCYRAATVAVACVSERRILAIVRCRLTALRANYGQHRVIASFGLLCGVGVLARRDARVPIFAGADDGSRSGKDAGLDPPIDRARAHTMAFGERPLAFEPLLTLLRFWCPGEINGGHGTPRSSVVAMTRTATVRGTLVETQSASVCLKCVSRLFDDAGRPEAPF